MQTIKYRFADGTTSEIEVTDEFYTLYAELVQQEKRNHWKETRRHISLEYLNENGIDFASPATDEGSRGVEGIFNPVTRHAKKDLAHKVPSLFLVPLIGVEPIRYHYHRILSPARLPIPPQRQR